MKIDQIAHAIGQILIGAPVGDLDLAPRAMGVEEEESVGWRPSRIAATRGRFLPPFLAVDAFLIRAVYRSFWTGAGARRKWTKPPANVTPNAARATTAGNEISRTFQQSRGITASLRSVSFLDCSYKDGEPKPEIPRVTGRGDCRTNYEHAGRGIVRCSLVKTGIELPHRRRTPRCLTPHRQTMGCGRQLPPAGARLFSVVSLRLCDPSKR
jgi:hypothetical protein